MLHGAHHGGFELRRGPDGAVRLAGRFAYGVETTLAEARGDRPELREVFAPRAFAARIDAGEEVHLLSHHDFDRPLASRGAGTLTLTDTAEALTFEATITAELRAAPYVADFVGALEAGLVRGLSPGFRLAEGGDEVRMQGGAMIRTVRAAELFELSAVTVPAYSEAQIEARTWTPRAERPDAGLARVLNRWRA